MKETITIRLEASLMEFIKNQAEKDIRSVNNYIEMVLTKHKQEIDQKQKSPAK